MKVRKPRPLKYKDGHLQVDTGMIYHRTYVPGNIFPFHRWLADDFKDIKRIYKWLGQAIAYLEHKSGSK